MTRAKIEGALLGAFGAFLLAVPWLVPAIADRFWVSVITEILIWSLFAASVNLLFGYVGLLSFGQALFFGCGMYGVAIGVAKLGLGFWPALGLGVACSAAMALVAGVFAVRLTWHYFAIITVVFSLIFYFLALTLKQLTGGDDGTSFALPAPSTHRGSKRTETSSAAPARRRAPGEQGCRHTDSRRTCRGSGSLPCRLPPASSTRTTRRRRSRAICAPTTSTR